ncbi:MAG: hypothetical protein AAGF47_01250 [Planctomycetota bacterium]
MNVALNPYDLTARSEAALAALLLADRVWTVMPSPQRAPSAVDIGRAAMDEPAFAELLNAWSWAMPLFSAGIASGAGDVAQDMLAAIRGMLGVIEQNDRFASVRPFMHQALAEPDEVYLRAFCGDLLRSGADPAMALPVSAGIDAAAADYGLLVVRGEACSHATRLEQGMIRELTRVAVPFLSQAGGQRLLAARADLEPSLDAFRDAVNGWRVGEIRDASQQLTEAFDTIEAELCRPTDADEPRVLRGQAVVTFGELSADAVLRAGAAAASAVVGGPPGAHGVHSDTLLVRTMVVRRLGARR